MRIGGIFARFPDYRRPAGYRICGTVTPIRAMVACCGVGQPEPHGVLCGEPAQQPPLAVRHWLPFVLRVPGGAQDPVGDEGLRERVAPEFEDHRPAFGLLDGDCSASRTGVHLT
jgi:hypothetical protein